ncbi:MAG: hypothetical protein J0H01_19885 [Rhizobiales bacterium]|nr:hypothetical protein [Hyphomicrobiales bacterium]
MEQFNMICPTSCIESRQQSAIGTMTNLDVTDGAGITCRAVKESAEREDSAREAEGLDVAREDHRTMRDRSWE